MDPRDTKLMPATFKVADRREPVYSTFPPDAFIPAICPCSLAADQRPYTTPPVFRDISRGVHRIGARL